MMRHRILGPLSSFWGAALLVTLVSTPEARADGPEAVVRQALQANPATAPYNLLTAYRNGQVVLAGTVGSKQIHDIAIRLAIASGYPVRDDLVIDTAMAHRVAAAQAQWQAQAAAAGRTIGAAGGAGLAPSLGNLPYVYPPPLFGRIDDPFFGFEPPLLSYPPWWRAVVARAQAGAPATATAPAPADPSSTIGTTGAGVPGAGAGAIPQTQGTVSVPMGSSPPGGTIEMTIDPRGNAVLRGIVPTLADRIAIGQRIAQTPGVREVINLLQVGAVTQPITVSETTPSPPQPELSPLPPAAQPPAGAAPAPAQDANPGGQEQSIVVDGGPLNERLTQAFARRPALAGLPIKVTVRDGIATLSGKVPTVYEAMLAFRLVEQTPGIRDVNDRLEFTVPDGERQNPLIKQGRPEDVEPYLAAQVRRNLGDLAHLDRIKLLGDTLELWGTIARAEDRPRVDAILRSIAVLRGFRLEPHFDAE